MISVQDLTMIYPNKKGVFNLSFLIKAGEAFGYLGPNGAGKTTTIRNLLGFIKPDSGKCSIHGLDCWRQAASIHKDVGYIPGEIAFFDHFKGNEFLQLLFDMRSMKDKARLSKLTERFEIDTSLPIRKMSKGMKQKIGILAAFMHDPAVYVMDEPSSGLDPLMQKRFIELILEEKGRGKTMLMSSHQFDEIDRTCDRAGIIYAGRLVAVEDIRSLKQKQRKKYLVTVASPQDVSTLKKAGLSIISENHLHLEILVSGQVDSFIRKLAPVEVTDLDVGTSSLEERFMQFYSQEV